MNELTLKFDYCEWLEELPSYLCSLDGILDTKTNSLENEVYIQYHCEKISIEIVKLEILLFLNILKIPSIIAFDKHSKKVTLDYRITINDLCCEYCLKGMIGELLTIDGIEKVTTDFDYNDKKEVCINIKYDNYIIDLKTILELEKRFNNN